MGRFGCSQQANCMDHLRIVDNSRPALMVRDYHTLMVDILGSSNRIPHTVNENKAGKRNQNLGVAALDSPGDGPVSHSVETNNIQPSYLPSTRKFDTGKSTDRHS